MAAYVNSGEEGATEKLFYPDWTERLGRHFFRPEYADVPVTVFIDDELLGALSGLDDPEQGVQSLVWAVSSRLSTEESGLLFDSIHNETFRWKLDSGEGFPPCLPLLAVAVLAATHMVAEEGVGAGNYYRRFRDLLGIKGSGEPRGYGDSIPLLWHQLIWWLEEKHEGRLGRSTLKQHPTLANIGFALSQALFREADRRRLTEFFRWLGLSPHEEVSEVELLTYFRVWPGLASLGAGVRRMVDDESNVEELGRILSSTAKLWNGVVLDEAGTKVGQLVVVLDRSPPPKVGFRAQMPEGFPRDGVFSSPDADFTLSSSAGEWYDELIPLNSAALQKGLSLTSTGLRISWHPRLVIPLRTVPALSAWASVPHIVPSEAHCVLAHESAAAAVVEYLAEAAPDHRPLDRPGLLPDGWRLYTDVFINSPPAEPVDNLLEALVPAIGERPALRGGLRLRGGQNTYLRGGEPDLWVPARTLGSGTITVLLETAGSEVPLEHQFPAEGGNAALRLLELPAGSHTVISGPTRIPFQTIETEGVMSPAEAGAVAHELVREGDGYEATRPGAARPAGERDAMTVRVAGALVAGNLALLPPAPEPPLIALYRDEEFLLLGAAPGQIQQPVPPKPPDWPAGLELRTIGYEIYPEFEPAWIITRSRLKGLRARVKTRLEPLPEIPQTANRAMVERWAKQFERAPAFDDPADEGLWARYRDAARAIAK